MNFGTRVISLQSTFKRFLRTPPPRGCKESQMKESQMSRLHPPALLQSLEFFDAMHAC